MAESEFMQWREVVKRARDMGSLKLSLIEERLSIYVHCHNAQYYYREWGAQAIDSGKTDLAQWKMTTPETEDDCARYILNGWFKVVPNEVSRWASREFPEIFPQEIWPAGLPLKLSPNDPLHIYVTFAPLLPLGSELVCDATEYLWARVEELTSLGLCKKPLAHKDAGAKGGAAAAQRMKEIRDFALALAASNRPTAGWQSAPAAADAVYPEVQEFARRIGRGISRRKIAEWFRAEGIKKS